jgi:hypothetical protein
MERLKAWERPLGGLPHGGAFPGSLNRSRFPGPGKDKPGQYDAKALRAGSFYMVESSHHFDKPKIN